MLDPVITYPVILPDFFFVHDDRWTKRTCRIYTTSRKTNLKVKHKVKLRCNVSQTKGRIVDHGVYSCGN